MSLPFCFACYGEPEVFGIANPDPVSKLWLVNPAGGYGRRAAHACTGCLKKPYNAGLVERLVEAYPQSESDALRKALA